MVFEALESRVVPIGTAPPTPRSARRWWCDGWRRRSSASGAALRGYWRLAARLPRAPAPVRSWPFLRVLVWRPLSLARPGRPVFLRLAGAPRAVLLLPLPRPLSSGPVVPLSLWLPVPAWFPAG